RNRDRRLCAVPLAREVLPRRDVLRNFRPGDGVHLRLGDRVPRRRLGRIHRHAGVRGTSRRRPRLPMAPRRAGLGAAAGTLARSLSELIAMRWQLTRAAPSASGSVDESIKRHLILTRLQDVVAWGQKNSIWPFNFGLSCCYVEMATAFTS